MPSSSSLANAPKLADPSTMPLRLASARTNTAETSPLAMAHGYLLLGPRAQSPTGAARHRLEPARGGRQGIGSV